MPGGGAELFHPEIRKKVVRGKCTGQEWLDVIEEAHTMGIKSNVTMLYGHMKNLNMLLIISLKFGTCKKRQMDSSPLFPQMKSR